MSERITYKRQRVELRQQRLRLALESETLRDVLRTELSPIKDIAELDDSKLVDAVLALAQQIQTVAGLDRKIAILDSELDA